MRICKFCATSGAITNASQCVRRRQIASSFMNARTATVLEVDNDVQAARNATRGILIAASRLRAADSADLRSRAAKSLRLRRLTPPRSTANRAFRKKHCRRARRTPFGNRRAAENWAARAPHRRRRGRLLCARPRLRFHCYDLRDAPDQGRLRGASRQSQRWHQLLLRRLANEQLLLASSTTKGRAAAMSATAPPDRARRLAPLRSSGSHRHLLRTSRRRRCHHRAACCRCSRFRSGSRRLPQAGLHARAVGRLGRVRHARHVQRRFQTPRVRFERANPTRGYDKIHAQTMMPVAHLLWSAAWAGIATAAAERAAASCARPHTAPAARCRPPPPI